jgi:K+-sensing histidine kinase KdpD
LAIAKHLVDVHGGRLWVDSEVGQGSQFHFSVPLFDSKRTTPRPMSSGLSGHEDDGGAQSA